MTGGRGCEKCVELFTSFACNVPGCVNFTPPAGVSGEPYSFLHIAGKGVTQEELQLFYHGIRSFFSASDKRRWCDAICETDSEYWYCTRQRGHTGAHIAFEHDAEGRANGKIAAAWTEDKTTERRK